LSDTAVSYSFEPLEPSDPPPRDAPARLLAQAQEQADQIREQARADGYAQGLAAGHEDGAAQVSAAASALGEALAGVESMRVEVSEAVERDAIELGLALAEKILAGALAARPELVVEVVQGALRRVSGQRAIAVRLNPSDVQVVSGAIGDLQSQANGLELCDLQSDQRVPGGSAVVRTAEGEVDASVQTQLERAREVAFAELTGGEPTA
jgi:flagellar assembly protein FliH